jgi:hypothetical protein
MATKEPTTLCGTRTMVFPIAIKIGFCNIIDKNNKILDYRKLLLLGIV